MLKSENLLDVLKFVTGELDLFVYRGRNREGTWETEYLGDGFSRITHMSISEFLYEIHDWKKMIHPEDLERARSSISENFDRPGKASISYRIVTKNGLIKWVTDHKVVSEREDGTLMMDGVVLDITQTIEKDSKIKDLTNDLQETNLALTKVISSIENDKTTIKKKLSNRFQESIFPLIDKLSEKIVDEENKYIIDIIRNRIKNICLEFDIRINSNSHLLTPTEQEICEYIIDGIPSKKIASIMSNSEETIKTHRKNIRKKFKIDRSTNLRKYLLEKY